ncbi:hypothetical protein LWF01_09130 [Saxibacter everestensis]|uniref:Histidine kinase/HSP90-like ATPase domain-containing protein n=1 Tax=Saxibacter everestensis TaxID=2909229 RepID=A0ABY8R0D8_9MICO|nr:hypothetical protein LWF01_09130 [Brevibacteriaceae bacterium ZFBP1038]
MPLRRVSRADSILRGLAMRIGIMYVGIGWLYLMINDIPLGNRWQEMGDVVSLWLCTLFAIFAITGYLRIGRAASAHAVVFTILCCMGMLVSIAATEQVDEKWTMDSAIHQVLGGGSGAAILGLPPSRRNIVLIGGLFLVVHGLAVVWLAREPQGPSMNLLVLLRGPLTWLVLYFLALVLRRAFSAYESSQEDLTSVWRRVAAEAQKARQTTEANRLLHDTVLSTLAVLAHGGAGVDQQRLREMARSDARTLRGEPAAPQPGFADAGKELLGVIRELVDDQIAGTGPKVLVSGQLSLDAPLDAGTREALLGAIRQAVHNVVQHARADTVVIALSSHESTLRTVITDDGVGFDPRSIPTSRFGIWGSIESRIAERGGQARIFSTPGQGTTISLVVPL